MSALSDLPALSLYGASQGLAAGNFTAVELTEALLNRISDVDPSVKSYISVTADLALQKAAAADLARTGQADHPLLGIPIAVKDVISTAGVETTCGSRILKGYVPPYTANSCRQIGRSRHYFVGQDQHRRVCDGLQY